MPSRRFVFLFLLILALALALRLFSLGALPLSDYEATWALQALGLARGQHPSLGPQPAYDVLTAFLFFVFGASNFLARFWPALAGVLLVLTPWLLRERLGTRTSLILALGLAIDPGLWALARLAGGPMLAVTFLTLTIVLWQRRQYALAGVCLALALLAGPAVWFGALTLALSGLAYSFWSRRSRSEPIALRPWATDWASWRAVWPCALGTLLLVGTACTLVPNALSAMAGALPQFLRGWWTPSGTGAGLVALALPADEMLPLLFGLMAAARGLAQRDHFSVRLSLWALVAFLVTMLYPGRQTGDLAWVILPLWMLAAQEIERYLHWGETDRRAVIPLAVFTLLLLMLAWFMLAHTTFQWVEGSFFQQPVLQMAAGVLLFLAISLVLAGLSWDPATALHGGLWGLLAALTIATAGLGTSAAGIRRPPTVSLWQPPLTVAQAALLRQTVDQISNWNRGYVGQVAVHLAALDSPAMQWLLRDYEVSITTAAMTDQQPEVLITPAGVLSPQEAGYRGQDFIWRQQPAWESASALDWLRWWLFRTLPQTNEEVILWVRPDLTLRE